MASKSRLYSHFNRFIVSNFSYHNNVWIMAQERSQTRSKCESGYWVNLSLIHTIYAVFNRIFNSPNIYLRGIENIKNTIQRGGFSGARWTCYKNKTIRFFQIFGDNFAIFSCKT